MPVEDFRVRTARTEDVPEIAVLMQRAVKGLSTGYYNAQETQNAATYLTIPDLGIIQDQTYYVVVTSSQIVACGGWSSRRKPFTGASDQEVLSDERLNAATEAARIRAFFVDPNFARRGLAPRLYQCCEEAARKAGYRAFELMATLPGVSLYEHLEFIEVDRVDVELPNGSKLPCVQMRRNLV